MAAPTSVPAFCTLLARSRLATQDEVKSLYRRYRDGEGDIDDADAFARWLVAERAVTEYQAWMVRRGHTGGFFLGPYKILDKLGAGNVARVYKGLHPLGQFVALKVLPSSKAADANTLARFVREGQMVTRLDHPNVVRAFQIGQDGGRHYLVMELLEGDSLADVLKRRGPLPPVEAISITAQALAGLEHLASLGIIHRDLKPANLMLVGPAASPTVKILDVGLGREESGPGDDITTESMLLGTPDYLSPEQARNARAVDVRSDIYSLGCVLFHMLAGRTPFPDVSILSQITKHATDQLTRLEEVAPGCPAGLQEVLDRMTAKDPGDRYATPGEAMLALQAIVDAPITPKPALVPTLPAFSAWLGEQPELPPTPRPSDLPTLTLALPPPEPIERLPPPPSVEVEREEPARVEGILPQSRRDWLLVGLGAGSVVMAAGAIGIGYLLSRRMGRRAEVPPEE